MIHSPRIVIGAGRPNKLPALVAEFSIIKHSPMAKIIHTYDRPFLKDGNNKIHRDRWEEPCDWLHTRHPHGTMFSYCRHMVPEICNHQGHAIYMDSDKVVLAPIDEVWALEMDEAKVLRVIGDHQFSVLKIDCAGLKDYPVKRLLTQCGYRDVQKGRHLPLKWIKHKIPTVWNSTDRLVKGAKLLHYTRMPTQPWAKPGHRVGHVWFDHLAEAVIEGFISMETVEEEIREQDLKHTWQAAVYPQPHVLEELKGRL